MSKTWKCQRSDGGVKCGWENPARKRLCEMCGKARPPKKRPAHMAALDLSYEHYIEINGGEHCGICGKGPSNGRRLDRDHDHKTGQPRGLLCWVDNKFLRAAMTTERLEAALAYLRRAEQRASEEFRVQPQGHVALITELAVDSDG